MNWVEDNLDIDKLNDFAEAMSEYATEENLAKITEMIPPTGDDILGMKLLKYVSEGTSSNPEHAKVLLDIIRNQTNFKPPVNPEEEAAAEADAMKAGMVDSNNFAHFLQGKHQSLGLDKMCLGYDASVSDFKPKLQECGNKANFTVTEERLSRGDNVCYPFTTSKTLNTVQESTGKVDPKHPCMDTDNGTNVIKRNATKEIVGIGDKCFNYDETSKIVTLGSCDDGSNITFAVVEEEDMKSGGDLGEQNPSN